MSIHGGGGGGGTQHLEISVWALVYSLIKRPTNTTVCLELSPASLEARRRRRQQRRSPQSRSGRLSGEREKCRSRTVCIREEPPNWLINLPIDHAADTQQRHCDFGEQWRRVHLSGSGEEEEEIRFHCSVSLIGGKSRYQLLSIVALLDEPVDLSVGRRKPVGV